MGYRQEITKGTTSHLATVTIRRTDTGQLKTGLAFGDMTIGYLREGASALTSVTPVTMTAGTWASGGWIEVGSGVYQFGVPDVALASGANGVEFLFQAASAIDQTLTIVLQDVDHRDSVRFGLSSLPNAAAGAVGGLPVEDANGNIPVDLARWLGDVPLTLVSQLVQAQANQLGAQAKLDVNAEADTALSDYDPPTNAEMEARTLVAANYGTSVNQTTILNRIGAFAGSGVNTILGFFQSLGRKDVAAPTDMGGTYDPAADSQEAIRDRGDAAWTTGAGADPSAIADAVWDEAKAGHVAAGSFGEEVQSHATPSEVKTQADQALTDYDPPTRAELTSDKNEIITEVNANETKIDLLETKAQADTRQTALIAEHDVTQAELANATYGLAALNTDLDTLLARLTSARATLLDNLSNLDASVSSRSSHAALDVWHVLESAIATASTIGVKVKTNLDATVSSRESEASASTRATTNQTEHDATQTSILTRAAPGDAMALTSAERDLVANALLDLVDAIESGLTPRAALRIILASQAGKLSGAGTSTIRIRDVADTKDRIVGTVDGTGNRTATTVDGD